MQPWWVHTAEKAQTASVAVRINIPGSPDASLICNAVPTFKSEIAAIALAGAPPPCFVATFADPLYPFLKTIRKFFGILPNLFFCENQMTLGF